MSNLLAQWLQENRHKLRDKRVRIGNMVFHIPFDGSQYLNFKCASCGSCCQNLKFIQLTFGDLQRLTKKLGYPTTNEFLKKECVFAETHVENIYASVSHRPYSVKAQTFFLKRFAGETEETQGEMHACRFLTEDNLCQIYDVRPMVCRKYPFSVYVEHSLYHAYYTNQEECRCQGYVAKRRVKTKWLTPLVKPLIQGCKEIYESLEKGLLIITEVKQQW